MRREHRLARTAGVLYLVTFVTSIPALALKQPYLDGTGSASAARWATVLEVGLAVACAGTAVALLPLLRRHDEALAVGFVASRTVEAATILVGVVALLALVGSGRDGEGAAGLVAVHDAAFLVGPGLLPAVNATLLGTALHRGRRVPRPITLIGLAGAPVLLGSALATLLGGVDQVSTPAAVAAAPIALWELSLGIWLATRGLRPDIRDRT